MSRVLFGLAYAAGIPAVGLALMLSSTVLVASGPPVFDGWIGLALAWLLMVAGLVIVAFSQMRYGDDGFVFLGAFLPLMIGLYLLHTAYQDKVVLDRGELTACTIVNATRHQEHTNDGTWHVWYTYDLTCARPEVTAMVAEDPAGEAGDSVTVLFDPTGRLKPRPADAVGDPRTRAIRGAVVLGVGIVLRLLGELSRISDTTWPSRSSSSLRTPRWRKEQRRVRRLARARSRGNLQTRVGWLLSYHQHDRNQPPMQTTNANLAMAHPGSGWAVRPVLAQRCQVALGAAPPAIEDLLQSLCDLYVIGDRRRYVENVVAGDREPVAADDADLRRWSEATDAYLSELAAVNRDLWQYWIDHGQRLGLSWGRTALLRSWQDHVRSGYARLARAADAYRPVFFEISAAIATTRIAEHDLQTRHRRLQEWERRQLWYLKPTANDSILIVRSDVSSEPPPDGTTRPLRAAFYEARAEHDRRLIPVDWDEASLRACDGELAQMSAAYPPVGATRSGRSLINPSPVTFAAWFREEYQVAHDRFSDRDDLARRRRERDQARTRGSGRRSEAGGGSWPTDPGSHDYGGGDYGTGGYSGGGDYGGSYGGFSVGGSY